MKPQRILIADDDEKVLTLLNSSLKKEGFETILANNGAIALRLAQKEHPDLILADVAMPEMDGFDLCQAIRDEPATTHIPFIFLTAKGELNDKVRGLNLGADDYISKPFHISEVTARIKSILQRVALMAQYAPESEESDLKGNLEQMQFAEVIQTLSMAQKSGGLTIVKGNKTGKMFFEQGNIVHAELDNYTGDEAVYRLLIWEEGYFEFDSKTHAPDPSITVSLNSLLMEGFSQREEYFKYKKALPSLSSVLKVVAPEKAAGIKPTSQKVLDIIDGQRTILSVIENSPVNYLLTVKVIYTLLKKDVLEASEPDLSGQLSNEDYGQLADDLYE